MSTITRSPLPAALSTAALLAALPATLAAQTAAGGGNRFVPEDSCLVLRIASPAKWAERFGKTQVAKLMSSQSLAPIVQQVMTGYERGIEAMRKEGKLDADLANRLVTEWKGDIIVSLQLDWDGFSEAIQWGEVPPMSFVVALTPDGTYDFEKLADEIQRATEESPEGEDLRDLQVGELTLRSIRDDEMSPTFTLPHVVDGHLVMLGGMSLEQDAAKLLANEGRYNKNLGAAPLYVHADLEGLVSMMMDEMAGAPAPFDLVAVLESLGVNAVDSFMMSLDADGQHVVGEWSLGLKGSQRGLFDMIPRDVGQLKMLSSVPASVDSFSVSAMDVSAIFKTIEGVWGELEDMVPITWDDAMAAFTEGTKVRLKEDLLAHLGKEMLVVQDTSAMSLDAEDLENDFEDNPMAMLSGSVFGFSLADAAAFDKSLETALRSRGMHVGRKTQDYANAKIHRMKLAGLIELEYVVTNDALLLAIGGDEGTQRTLRSVLDTRAAGDGELPENVQQRVADMQAGWCGLSVTPLANTFGMLADLAQQSPDLDDEGRMFASMLGGLCKDMQRLGIGSMVSATYASDSGLTSRFRW